MTIKESLYPLTDSLTLTEKKRIYVMYIENLCRFGYDISDRLHPNYSKLNIDYIAHRIIDLINEHDESFESCDLERTEWQKAFKIYPFTLKNEIL